MSLPPLTKKTKFVKKRVEFTKYSLIIDTTGKKYHLMFLLKSTNVFDQYDHHQVLMMIILIENVSYFLTKTSNDIFYLLYLFLFSI